MSNFSEQLYQALERGQDVVLATIVAQSGSTPRTSGSRMLILPDGEIVGTIGGGIVEAKVIGSAEGVLRGGEPFMLTYDLTRTDREDSLDIICGGRLTVLLEPIPATNANIELFKDRYLLQQQGMSCLTISAMVQDGGTLKHIERCLCASGRVIRGIFSFPDPMLDTLMHHAAKLRVPSLFSFEGRQFLIDPPFSNGCVYIFGAGHVSLQLARLTSVLPSRL